MTTEEETMASHKELRELMLICLHATTITTTTTTTLFQYSHVSTWYYLHTFHLYDTLTKKVT